MIKTIILIISLFFSICAFAQEIKLDVTERTKAQKFEAFWQEKVDITTPWGQWLDSTKSYWYQISQAKNNTLLKAAKMHQANMSLDALKEYLKKVDGAQLEFYKALQAITPTAGLETYHHKQIDMTKVIVDDIPLHKNAQEVAKESLRLTKEAQSELVTVLLQHGVPAEVVDDFSMIK